MLSEPHFRPSREGGSPSGGGFGGDFGGCGTKDWIPAFAGMTGAVGAVRWAVVFPVGLGRVVWAVWCGMSGAVQETLHNAQFTR
jgi:hypothetical protein